MREPITFLERFPEIIGRYTDRARACGLKSPVFMTVERANEDDPWNGFWAYWENITLFDEDESVARGKLGGFPGCCGACILSQAKVFGPTFEIVSGPDGLKWRGRGFGTLMHELRLELAKAAGWTVAYATNIEEAPSAPQTKIFRKFGWETVDTFQNLRTDHKVILWRKRL